MMTLPAPKSTNWVSIFAVTFVANFIALVLSRILLNIDTPLRTNVAFFLISGVVSFTSAVGYIGLKPWYVVSVTGNLLSIAYLLYLSATNKNDGWTDLTSVISYFTITLGAFLLGAIIQLCFYLYKVIRHS